MTAAARREAAATALTPHLPKLYALLHALLCDGSNATDRDHQRVQRILQQQGTSRGGWVWVGGQFAAAHQVALESSIAARPYLFVLPPDLAPFTPTLVKLGVRRSFGAHDWAAALTAMARDFKSTPLDAAQLDLAVALVQKVSDGGEQTGRDAEVMAPDEDRIMRPAADMVYDDAPWMSAAAKQASGQRVLVHAKISAAVADKVVYKMRASTLCNGRALTCITRLCSRRWVSSP